MDKFDKDLEWKNHNPFYFNLNKDLDELKQISFKVKDLKFMQEYYDYIENFLTHYSPYMNTGTDEGLNDIRKIVYSIDFEKLLVAKSLETQKQLNLYNNVLDKLKKLKKIHSNIVKSIYDNGLSPRMNTRQLRMSELETDKKKKSEYQALEQAGMM